MYSQAVFGFTVLFRPSLPVPSPSFFPHPSALGLSLAVVLAVGVVVMSVVEEEVLVGAVGGEGDSRDAEAGEGGLEAVPAGEAAGVSPGLSVYASKQHGQRNFTREGEGKGAITDVLSHGS